MQLRFYDTKSKFNSEKKHEQTIFRDIRERATNATSGTS
ncbi:hypothetical protein Vi05172_g12928 [Venturia inaequalis]|nr:hypothetical protein Vi05172_g12928 [Venturia inaequalis]